MLKFVLGSYHIGIIECRCEESNTMLYYCTKTVIFVSQTFPYTSDTLWMFCPADRKVCICCV